MALFILVGLSLAFLVINRPFDKLACHQDAGWHSYWAAFRKRGITLDQQLNVLMGCARIGSKAFFVLWFAFFGLNDPDQISRKAMRFLNILTAVGIYLFFAPHWGETMGLVMAGVSLAAISIPSFGVHYETAEMSVRPINFLIFVACAAQITTGSSLMLGMITAIMIACALLFKITQLFEYLPLWLVLFCAHPGLMPFATSCIGGAASVGGFALLLASLGLLKTENLGILGYLSTSRSGGQTTNTVPALALERRIDAKLKNNQIGIVGKTIILILRRMGLIKLLPPLIGLTVNGREFIPTVMTVAHTLATLTMAGGFLIPPSPEKTLLLAWLAGALIGLIAQSRFLPFHFIPAVLPASLLAGHALFLIWQSQSPFWLSLLGLGIMLDALGFYRLRKIPLDLRFWPKSQHSILALNRKLSGFVETITAQTQPDDSILVWGCLPQLYVLSNRRSPVNWLSTNAIQMDPILPHWRTILWQRMRECPPALIIEASLDLDLDEIARNTGLIYHRQDNNIATLDHSAPRGKT